LRTWYHLKAYHSIQAWFPFIFGCSKNRDMHCETIFTCWVFIFYMASHLAQQHRSH
jgi:hypothetical protein